MSSKEISKKERKVLGLSPQLGKALLGLNLLTLVFSWLVIFVVGRYLPHDNIANMVVSISIYASGVLAPFSMIYIVGFLAKRRSVAVWLKIWMVFLGVIFGLNFILVTILATIFWALRDF